MNFSSPTVIDTFYHYHFNADNKVHVDRGYCVQYNLIPEQLHRSLLEHIKELPSEKFGNIHTLHSSEPNGQIQYLIDPCLYCNWYNNDLVFKEKMENEWANNNDNGSPNRNRKQHGNKKRRKRRRRRRGRRSGRGPSKTFTRLLFDNTQTQKQKQTPTAIWIPAEYDIESASFVTAINDLSFIKYGYTLYPTISEIFAKMIPMFVEVLENEYERSNSLFHSCPRFQVVVEMQDMQLQSQFSERAAEDSEDRPLLLRKEGLEMEHIVAVGMYFFDVSKNMSGDLQLATTTTSAAYHFNNEPTGAHARPTSITVSENTCVVFSNVNIVHGMTQFAHRNTFTNPYPGNGNGSRRLRSTRKMLKFSVIDPSFTAKSSLNIIVNWNDITMQLLEVWCSSSNPKDKKHDNSCILNSESDADYKDLELEVQLPSSIVNVIIEFVIGDKITRYNNTLRNQRIM